MSQIDSSTKINDYIKKLVSDATSVQQEFNCELLTTEHVIYALLKRSPEVLDEVNAIMKHENTMFLLNSMEKTFASVNYKNFGNNIQNNRTHYTINIEPQIANLLTHVFVKSDTNIEDKYLDMLVIAIHFPYCDVLKNLNFHISDDEFQNSFTSKINNYLKDVIGLMIGLPDHEGMERSLTENRAKQADDPLEAYTIDMLAKVQESSYVPTIGREEIILQLCKALSRKKKPSAVLTGDAGVGKTQIAYGLAERIVNKSVPDNLQDIILLELNVTSLMAGTMYRGDLEARMDALMKALKEKTNVVLFIDEIHMIAGAGQTTGSNMDISNMLKPALADGYVRVIGATTDSEFNSSIGKDPALERRFSRVFVPEMTKEDTLELVQQIKESYEKHHDVVYSEDAIKLIINLSDKFLKSKRFPDKTIDVMDLVASSNRIKEKPESEITTDAVYEEMAEIAKLPVELVKSSNSTLINNLAKNLKANVFGQDQAIDKITEIMTIAQAGLRESNSIKGAFLLVGSSGSGKTETAKTLADSLGLQMIRFDMSEFMEKHTVSKLIGAPAGYVGYEDEGKLISEVEKYPNAVLLLDEIEKAHPDILKVFLQVIDDGRLTSSKGKTVYFDNITLIMTSNLGIRLEGQRSIGFGSDNSDAVMKAVKQALAPEFINRIDAILRYYDLQPEVISKIVDKNIKNINDMIKDRGYNINIDELARKWLIKHGTEKGMGARPMKRCVDSNVKVLLAPLLLNESEQKEFTVSVLDDKIILK